MTTPVLLIIIAAAFLHALWNLGSRHYRNRAGFIWGLGLWSGIWALLCFPFALQQMDWSVVPILCGLLSGLALSIYYRCLERAYRYGDISIVYPIIRSSPLWVSLIGVSFLGAELSGLAWTGIGLTLAGVFILPLGQLRSRAVIQEEQMRSKASLFAIGASIGTCMYTLSDKVAMDLSAAGPLAGVALAGVSSSSKMFFWYFVDPAARVGFNWKKLTVEGLPVWQMAGYGFCAFAAYALVIGAMIYADAGRVLAVSNLSVVLGAVGGILFFKERSGLLTRILGLILVVAGVVMLRLF